VHAALPLRLAAGEHQRTPIWNPKEHNQLYVISVYWGYLLLEKQM
jgi:hypothetical protein